MATANLNVFIRRLARGMKAETLGDQSDRELVERFLAARDEAAFEALLRRHAPMVYRVCWRVLQQEQDVEDAFQATFLLLAQKLQTVRKQASLGSWLHGVAHRVALKAKARAATRDRHERQAAASRAVPADEVTWRELRVILDAELTRLPDRWRLPLILCYLESRTQDEAAEQLGWSKNTLRRRLEEAREALGRRLARGGVGPAALSAVLLSDCASPAAPPPHLIASAVEAGARVATGQAAAAVAPAGVAALVEGVGGTTVLPRGNIILALLLAGGFVAAATAFPVSRPLADSPEAREASGVPMRPQEPRADSPEAREASGVSARPRGPRAEDNQSRAADALAGSWRMTLPAGYKYQVRMRPLGADRVSVEKAVCFSGIYELRQGRLILVESALIPKKYFEWEVRGAEELALVAQPPVEKIGANYLGTTLRRLPEEGQPIPLPPVGPAGGRPEPPVARGRPPRDDRPAQGVQVAVKPPAPEGETSPEEADAARALERIKAEYRLKKEPAYQGPVQYCLLLLGRNAQTRVWLASDGKTMYVDRNGDGDLTQPGEAVPFKPDEDGGFASLTADRFPGGAGGPHTRLHIAVRQHDWETNKGGYWCVRAWVEGRYPMYAFAHKFAQKPDEAPVIHLGGPLRLGLTELERGRLVRGGGAELTANVSCHYPGVERAFVDPDEWGATGVHPVAEVRLPARTPGAEPVALRVPLTQHC
jgi:RNA polymerase sigma factor (sigma-70 family)